tara:strand:- start:52 stop:252 length:201 start_codon:yes stop_codon:yes gene_type:complete
MVKKETDEVYLTPEGKMLDTQLTPNDVGVLYSLIQASSIQVKDVMVVAPIIEKMVAIIQISKTKKG